MRILCVVPVFNEETKLNALLDKIDKNMFNNYNFKYLFINNGSVDKSKEMIASRGHKILNLKKNFGVGLALILGYFYALKYHYDIVIHLAGNGKMNPSEISLFIKKLKEENYDFVNGSRFLKGGSFKQNPIIRILLIKFYSIFLSIITKKKITDCSCGFRAFKTNILKSKKKRFIDKKLYTYGYEYLTYGYVLMNKKIKSCEIPVSMDYPTKKNYSKIKPITDWYIMAKFWLLGILEK